MIEREVAWAKVNLALHVRARRADGYHDIESLFAFAAHGDVLSAALADDVTLVVTGPFAGALAGEDDNLVLRAARALRDAAAPGAGAALALEKSLPVAAGLGGGSADAAAALRLLARLWGIAADDPRLMIIAASLGADVPACLASVTLRGEGRGDDLDLLDGASLTGTPMLLVNPGVPLATPPVFAGWDRIDRGPLAAGDPLAAALAGRNDLEAPAIALAPVIANVLAALAAQPGVVLSRMSGSGATCFALFESGTALRAAAAAIDPAWWRLETALK